MDNIIPWKELTKVIEPYYPKPRKAGRRPIGIERMLRIHFLQHWFELSDPAAEEALYDSQMLGDLLHGDETRLWGDSAYTGQKQVLKEHAPQAKDFTQKKGYKNRALSDSEKDASRHKSKTRSRVEHIFGIMKCQFGYNKERYKGLAKNAHSLYMKCALINLVISKRTLLVA